MANSISEWLQDGNNRVTAFEIAEPKVELLDFYKTIQESLDETGREVDPFWLSSKGTPYIVLALSFEPGSDRATGASYIVGTREKAASSPS